MVINGITVDVGSEFQAGVSRDELISTLHHAAFDSGFSLEIRTSRKIPPAKRLALTSMNLLICIVLGGS